MVYYSNNITKKHMSNNNSSITRNEKVVIIIFSKKTKKHVSNEDRESIVEALMLVEVQFKMKIKPFTEILRGLLENNKQWYCFTEIAVVLLALMTLVI